MGGAYLLAQTEDVVQLGLVVGVGAVDVLPRALPADLQTVE
jgi:hypothetical protein